MKRKIIAAIIVRKFLVRVIPVHAVIYLFLTVHETGKKSQTGIFKSLFLTVHEPE
jgi:hypothetical protein